MASGAFLASARPSPGAPHDRTGPSADPDAAHARGRGLHRCRGRGEPARGALRAGDKLSCRPLHEDARRRSADDAGSGLLSRGAADHDHPCQGRQPPEFRSCRGPRHLFGLDHAPGPVPELPCPATPPADREPRRADHRRPERDADPGAFRRRRQHRPGRSAGRRARLSAARHLRRAGPRHHERRHRQRDRAAQPRRVGAPRAVHGAADRLFARPARALHGDESGAFPEPRPVHQLPVLCRRVRGLRAEGAGRSRLRLHLLHRARQRRDHRARWCAGAAAAPAADAHLSPEAPRRAGNHAG